jgi:hypothetical protein
MSTITWPVAICPAQLAFGLRTNVLVSTSPLNGTIDTLEIPGARWVGSMTLPPATYADQAVREALFSEIGGQANRVALWHFARPEPRGTMRGSPTLSATAAAGATSLSIATTTGNTLLAGDMVKVGSQLVQVIADATAAASVLTVSVRPALRAQVASGGAVSWDKPTTTFILGSPDVLVSYSPGIGDGLMIEFVEAWT